MDICNTEIIKRYVTLLFENEDFKYFSLAFLNK